MTLLDSKGKEKGEKLFPRFYGSEHRGPGQVSEHDDPIFKHSYRMSSFPRLELPYQTEDLFLS